ncbi:hypothetical protein KAW18_12725 [candidate division WOR-3 bacterium]|nr:hypothetical protein [candidate division WOR-3 bacterium]
MRRMKNKLLREEGYYWIKIKGVGNWQLAEWIRGDYWWIIGDNTYYSDTEVVEVGEKVEKK